MAPVEITSQTSTLPVTLSQAKQHLRVEGNELETLLSLAIESAVTHLEKRLGRSLRETTTLVQRYESWPSNPIDLLWQPVTAISSLEYYDTDGSQQTVSSSYYRLIGDTYGASYVELDETFTKPALDSRSDAVELTYTAGYTASGSDIAIPPQIKWAILLQIEKDWGDVEGKDVSHHERSIDALIGSACWKPYA